MPKRRRDAPTRDIYKLYRRVLKKPELSKKEVDKMGTHIILLAQTICEHVWDRRFY